MPRPRSLLHADFPIEIQRVGGFGRPVGFAAFVWPDEMHTVALMTNDEDDRPVEGRTEEKCFLHALEAMLVDHGRMNEPQLFAFKEKRLTDISVVLRGFGLDWQIPSLLRDIDGACGAIDRGGLLH